MNDDDHEFHAIELVAHSVLSTSLDNLNDNFESLHQSQVILLTRLKLIEEKLLKIKEVNDESMKNNVGEDINRIRTIRKRLEGVEKKVQRIDKRMDSVEKV